MPACISKHGLMQPVEKHRHAWAFTWGKNREATETSTKKIQPGYKTKTCWDVDQKPILFRWLDALKRCEAEKHDSWTPPARSMAWMWCCTFGTTETGPTSVAGGLVQRPVTHSSFFSEKTRIVVVESCRLVVIKFGLTTQRKHLHRHWVAGRCDEHFGLFLSLHLLLVHPFRFFWIFL